MYLTYIHTRNTKYPTNTQSPSFVNTFLATVVLMIVNILLERLIRTFAYYEKHHSLVNLELSVTKRMFVTLFFNTGVVLLLVNANVDGSGGVLSGLYSDFTPDWYANVGTQLVLTMVLNIFAPHILAVGLHLQYLIKTRWFPAVSQRELNMQHLGPIFHLSYRHAHQCMTLFVTFIYGGGLPVLYPIAMVSFATYFVVDKYLFFRHYRYVCCLGLAFLVDIYYLCLLYLLT